MLAGLFAVRPWRNPSTPDMTSHYESSPSWCDHLTSCPIRTISFWSFIIAPVFQPDSNQFATHSRPVMLLSM